MSTSTLLLFDIDDTLIRRHARQRHYDAVRSAALKVYAGAADRPDIVVETAGKTEIRIAREILNLAGTCPGPREFQARTYHFCAEASRRFMAACPADLTDLVIDGIPEILGTLQARPDARLGLLTGCTQQIAGHKLAAARLARFFDDLEAGGFGSDREHREALVRLARFRAGYLGTPWPAKATVIVGDTPLDVAGALAGGVRCIAFAAGIYTAADLAAVGAKRVATTAAELEEAILAEMAATPVGIA